MSLLDKIKKNSTIKDAAILSASKFFTKKDQIQTAIPAMNIALSGELDGGFVPGLTLWCGPSKHFKSMFSLIMAKSYMDKYPDAVMIFYDCEFGTPTAYFTSLQIDTDRILHVPIMNMEEFKFDVIKQLENIDRGDHVVFVIDSLGNMSSKKEMDDAIDGKSVQDMSRAKQMKSIFRMITPYLNRLDIPMIAVNHIYMEQGLFPKAIVSGGCLAKGTKIKLSNGELREIELVQVGDLVDTSAGPKPVTHAWNPETLEVGEPDCYEIEFEDESTYVVSASHPFLVSGNWVEAEDLKVTDDVDVLK